MNRPDAAQIGTSHNWLIQPWYSQLFVDGDSPPSNANLYPEAAGVLSACEGSRLAIFTSSTGIEVRVCMESWTAEPRITDHHAEDGPDTATIDVPAGKITLWTEESVEFDLPEPGKYIVQVTGHNRESTEQALLRAQDRSRDFDDPQFQADLATLTGREFYVLRFWPA
jgi:hypothetical protein